MRILVPGTLLPRIRHELAERLPSHGRSHLAEALSASLGFASHASLRAAMDTTGWVPIRRYDLDIPAGVRRLHEISGQASSEHFDAAIRQAAAELGIVVLGKSYVDGLMAALDGYATGGMSALTPRQRLTVMIYQMTRRPSVDLATDPALIMEMGERLLLRIPQKLAACLHRSRGLDPHVADLLIDVMTVPFRVVHYGFHWNTGRSDWAEPIIEAMEGRVRQFLSAMVETWPEDLDPMAMPELDMEEFRPRRRDVRTVFGHGDGVLTIGMIDVAGYGGAENAIGPMHAFGMFMRGQRREEIHDFLTAVRSMRPGRELLNACMDALPPAKDIGRDGFHAGMEQMFRWQELDELSDRVEKGGAQIWLVDDFRPYGRIDRAIRRHHLFLAKLDLSNVGRVGTPVPPSGATDVLAHHFMQGARCVVVRDDRDWDGKLDALAALVRFARSANGLVVIFRGRIRAPKTQGRWIPKSIYLNALSNVDGVQLVDMAPDWPTHDLQDHEPAA